MILVGRASLFATPIATATQQGAAGERGIAGPEEELARDGGYVHRLLCNLQLARSSAGSL